MKLVTKCIANRPRLCLSEIVHEPQSAFILGCLITDHALGFYAMIWEVIRERAIHAVQICQGAPLVSRLLFANDGIIFGQAQDEVRYFNRILREYEMTLGQTH